MKQEAETGFRLAWNNRGLGGKGVVRKRMRKGDTAKEGPGRENSEVWRGSQSWAA